MNSLKALLLLLFMCLPFESGFAAQKTQFQLQVISSTQKLDSVVTSVPGTPSRSNTNCNGTVTGSGTTSTVSEDCKTTTMPGTAASVGTRYHYSEDMRVLLPGNTHLTIWCQEGYRTVFSNRKMSLKEAKGRRSGFCPFGF
jgi:hypothetical protein